MSADQSFINRIFRKLFVAYENLTPVVNEITKNASFNVNSELENPCCDNSTLCFITQEQYFKAVHASILIEEVNKEFNSGNNFCNDLQEDRRFQYLKSNFVRTKTNLNTEYDSVNTCIKLIYIKKELVDQYITIYKLLRMVLQQLHQIVQHKNLFTKSSHNKAKPILKLKSNSTQLPVNVCTSEDTKDLIRLEKEYQGLDNAVYILKDIVKNSSTGSVSCLKGHTVSRKIKLTNFTEKHEKEVEVTSIVGSKQCILECLLELATVKQYMRNVKGKKELSEFKNHNLSNHKTREWYTEELKNLNSIPSCEKLHKKTMAKTLLPIRMCSNNYITTKVIKMGTKETQGYNHLYNQQTANFVNSVTQLLKTISSSDARKIRIYACSEEKANLNYVSANKLLIENVGPCSVINKIGNEDSNAVSTRFHISYSSEKFIKQLNLSPMKLVESCSGKRSPKLKIFTLQHDCSGIMHIVSNKVFTPKCFLRKSSSQIATKTLNIEKSKKINVLTKKSSDLLHTTNNIFQKENLNRPAIYLNLKRSVSVPEQSAYRDSVYNFSECFITKRLSQKDTYETRISKTQLFSNTLEQTTELNIIKNSAKMNIDCIYNKELAPNSESATTTKDIKLSDSEEVNSSEKLTNEIIKLDLAIDVKSKYDLQNRYEKVTFKDANSSSSCYFSLPSEFKNVGDVRFSKISDLVTQLWSSNSYHLKDYKNWYMRKTLQVDRKSKTDNVVKNIGSNDAQQNGKLNSTSRNKSYYSRLDYYVDLLQKNFKQNFRETYEVRYFEVKDTSKRNAQSSTNWPTLFPGMNARQDNIYMAKSKYYNYPEDTDDRRASRKSVERRDEMGASRNRIFLPGGHGGTNPLANQPWAPFVTSDVSLPRVRYEDQVSQKSTISGNKNRDLLEYGQSTQTKPQYAKDSGIAKPDTVSLKSGKSVGSNVTNLSGIGKDTAQGPDRRGYGGGSGKYPNPTYPSMGGPVGGFDSQPYSGRGGPGAGLYSYPGKGGPGSGFDLHPYPGRGGPGVGSQQYPGKGGPGGSFNLHPYPAGGGPGGGFDMHPYPGRGGLGGGFDSYPYSGRGRPGGGVSINIPNRGHGRAVATDVPDLGGFKKYPGFDRVMGTAMSGHNLPPCGVCSRKTTSQSVGINTMKQPSTFKDSYVQPQFSSNKSQYTQASRQCACDNRKSNAFTQSRKEIPKHLQHANVQVNKALRKPCNNVYTQVSRHVQYIPDHNKHSSQRKACASSSTACGSECKSHQQFHQQQLKQQWLHQNVCKRLNNERYSQIGSFTGARGHSKANNVQVMNFKPTMYQQGKDVINTDFLKLDEKSQSIQCCLVNTDENVFLYRKYKISDSSHSTLHEADSQPSHKFNLNKINEQSSDTKSSEIVTNKLAVFDVGTQYDLSNVEAKNEENVKTSNKFTKHRNTIDYCGLLLNTDIDCSLSHQQRIEQKSKLLQSNVCEADVKSDDKEQLPVKLNKSQTISCNYLFEPNDTDNLLESTKNQKCYGEAHDIKLRKALETICFQKLLNKNHLPKDTTNNSKTTVLKQQKGVISFCPPVEVKYQTQAINAHMWFENGQEKLKSSYGINHKNDYFIYDALIRDKSNRNPFHSKNKKSPFNNKTKKRPYGKSRAGDSRLSMGDVKKRKKAPCTMEPSKYTIVISDLSDATTSTLDFNRKTQNCNKVFNNGKSNKTVCKKYINKKEAEPKSMQLKNKINRFKKPIKKFVSFTGSTTSTTENNSMDDKQNESNYISEHQRLFHEIDVSSNIDCIIHDACKVISQMLPQKSKTVNSTKRSPYKKYGSLGQSTKIYRSDTFWIPPDYEDSEFNFNTSVKDGTAVYSINKQDL